MEALLKSRVVVTSEAARELALQRGIAVRDALIAKGLPNERLFLAAPKLRASGEEDAAWTPRVQLTLVDQLTRRPALADNRSMNSAAEDRPLPDRLSIDPRSPHHVAAVFEHGVGIRLNDKERSDVVEYCISEGWVKVPAGKALDRRGQPLLIKLKGKVEAFYQDE